jgi:hypothetical protein
MGTQTRDAAAGRDQASGKVRFDDRGNAVWETQRGRRLEHPGLALQEEEHRTVGSIPVNAKGGVVGYNPYQSGMLKKKPVEERPRKKNLRDLSRWITMDKKLSNKG